MKTPKKYTVGFIFTEDLRQVLLIKKTKPEWQKNKLNGIGGKIEEGENPYSCFIREVKEESNIDLFDTLSYRVGKVLSPSFDVEVFTTKISDEKLSNVKSMTEEEVFLISVNNIFILDLLPSAKYLVPMCMQRYLDNNFKEFTINYHE